MVLRFLLKLIAKNMFELYQQLMAKCIAKSIVRHARRSYQVIQLCSVLKILFFEKILFLKFRKRLVALWKRYMGNSRYVISHWEIKQVVLCEGKFDASTYFS